MAKKKHTSKTGGAEHVSDAPTYVLPEDFDPFDYADAFGHVEKIADRLMGEVPRELGDMVYAIRTIATLYGGKLREMSEFYNANISEKGGAA